MPIFVLTFLISFHAAFATEVYFSPSPDCENRIVKAIEEAKKEIQVAVYSINNRKIVSALEAAKKRGIKIRILTDNTQAQGKHSLVLELLERGLDLRLHSAFKIEHNKFAVYDGVLISTGSFNWTGPAARSNSENCLFLSEPEVIGKYQERFAFLWEKNTAQGSQVKVAKLRSKSSNTASKKINQKYQ